MTANKEMTASLVNETGTLEVNYERTVHPWQARNEEITQKITYYREDVEGKTAEGSSLVITLTPNQNVFILSGASVPVVPSEGFENLTYRYIDNNGSMLKVEWNYETFPQLVDVISVSNKLDKILINVLNPPEITTTESR